VKALKDRSINTVIKREQQPFSQPNQKYSKHSQNSPKAIAPPKQSLLIRQSHQSATSPTKQPLADLLPSLSYGLYLCPVFLVQDAAENNILLAKNIKRSQFKQTKMLNPTAYHKF